MAKTEAFFELGDFMIEFESHYLGYAQVNIDLQPRQHSIRQDNWQMLKRKQISALQWSISAELADGERWWDLLCGSGNCHRAHFRETLFSNGGVLRLYPADRSRCGFEFKRVFVNNVLQQSGRELTCGKTAIHFDCEASITGNYFSRLPPGALPPDAPQESIPDVNDISQALAGLLAGKLDVTPDQTLRLNCFLPPPEGAYLLGLQACKEWTAHAPRRLEYALSGCFPLEQKAEVDCKLLTVAAQLHDYHLTANGIVLPGCVVKVVDFSGQKQLYNNTFCVSTLNFMLLLG